MNITVIILLSQNYTSLFTLTIEMNIQKKYSTRAKRLSLKVDHKAGGFTLTIPKHMPDRRIEGFLNDHQGWIAEKSKLLIPKVAIEDGALIPYQGIPHRIVIERQKQRQTDIDIVYPETLSSQRQLGSLEKFDKIPAFAGMTHKEASETNHPILKITTWREDITSHLKRWMVDQAKTLMTSLAHSKARQIGKRIQAVDFRDPASRWGSCSSAGRLMFSWRVMMAPPYVMDYLVAHEVAHLNHMDHSQKFWDLCYDLTDGDADSARSWFKQHGHELYGYF